MSIVPLVKATLYGRGADKARVLTDLHAMGRMHLIPLQLPAGDAAGGPSQSAREALAFLRACRQRRHQAPDATGFDAGAVERRALQIKARLRQLADEREFLRRRIRDLTPWGDFTLPPQSEVGELRLWFYIVPHYLMDRLQTGEAPWQCVHRDHRDCYVVVAAAQEPHGMPVERTHTGTRSLYELQRQRDAVELEAEDLEAERAALTRWCDLFDRALDRLEDEKALQRALQLTFDRAELFAVQGWVPAADLPRLQDYATRHRLALTSAVAEEADAPPTLLTNPPALRSGQMLVSFYMTPAYGQWDPSLAVLLSFATFFAMILSDAGYALLLAGVLVMTWRRWDRTDGLRQARRLGVYITGASLLWGVLIGSYFGVAPPPGGVFDQLRVIDTDVTAMLGLSVAVGIVHLIIANLIQMWHWRGERRARAAAGWIVLIAGGTLSWLVHAAGTSEAIWLGVAVMAFGALRVLRYSGSDHRPLRRALQGMLALTRITGAFGDVLSYLRLFALGLASAALALAFNDLAARTAAAFPAFGMLLALLILVLGHSLNFALGIMGGFVHGLRLNFIEFFGWSLDEEGTPFCAFAKKEKTAWSSSS